MTAQHREEYGKYFAARALVFCSLFCLYIRLWVDPLLLYHVQEPPVVVNLLVVYYLDIVRLENGYRRVALFVFLNTNFGSAID